MAEGLDAVELGDLIDVDSAVLPGDQQKSQRHRRRSQQILMRTAGENDVGIYLKSALQTPEYELSSEQTVDRCSQAVRCSRLLKQNTGLRKAIPSASGHNAPLRRDQPNVRYPISKLPLRKLIAAKARKAKAHKRSLASFRTFRTSIGAQKEHKTPTHSCPRRKSSHLLRIRSYG